MLTMSETKTVHIYNKNQPDNRQEYKGRTIGPWTVINTGNHTRWGVWDTATGLRLFHACPTLTEAKQILVQLHNKGLELTPKDSWDTPKWGQANAYTHDSIQAIGQHITPLVKKWTNKK